MIIYNPHNEKIISERVKLAEKLLNKIPAKYCFITGSFLYKEKYQDIDIFIVTRSKKKLKVKNKKVKITIIDFNDLYSLFYHSVSKSCIAKNVIPTKPLKATLADYWHVVNEAVPTLLNEKTKFHKNVRSLILYTEYFNTGEILDTFQLNEKIKEFQSYQKILSYIKENVPKIMTEKAKESYLKRFFYTQAGYYKDLRNYNAQDFLYNLSHEVTKVAVHG